MKNRIKLSLLVLFGISLFSSSCDLEKTVDLDLPSYQSQLVVECYLEVGKPFSAVVSESVDFFAPAGLPIISGAQVKITHRGDTYILSEGFFQDTSTLKLFNYRSPILCPPHYKEDFFLEITDTLGRKLTATAQILEVVPIDTIEFVWQKSNPDLTTNDSCAVVITRFFDPPNEDNFYRRMFQKGGTLGEGDNEFDFTTTDNIADENGQMIFATSPDFYVGDTIITTLFHIEESYYDFTESVQSAINGNGNPFGQPSAIKSNVEGGIGIFAGISFDRKKIVVDK